MEYKGISINVVMLDWIQGIKGSVRHNLDDSFTIFMNAALSYDEQVEVFNHELRHIEKNDFDKYDVDMIEYNCHRRKIYFDKGDTKWN